VDVRALVLPPGDEDGLREEDLLVRNVDDAEDERDGLAVFIQDNNISFVRQFLQLVVPSRLAEIPVCLVLLVDR